MVVLDTNIIIDHLRQEPGKETKLKKLARSRSKNELALSVVTVQELYEGQSTREAETERALLATISPLRILPYTFEIAQQAGKIARDSKRVLELADALIAATAISYGAQLATLNIKDFQDIPGLEFAAYE
ncbi:type II toxin-antitoxin system VapC family toxin [Patescibacteria group bacterium]|nr:type II toxin-antitoxin system VapC family toxin [Patescibacteria group bacterium]